MTRLLALCLMLSAGPALAAEDPHGALMRLWPGYVERFISYEGRVIDNGNGNVSHSEGQGYAMRLAVATLDKPIFERVYGWTRRELGIREDGLFAWVYDPELGHVRDRNNATDGDLLVAWALAEGAETFDDAAMRFAARRLTSAIIDELLFENRGQLMLKPGALGFSAEERADGPVVNLSYFVFPALEALGAYDPQERLKRISQGGLALVEEARFGPRRLPSDWVALGGETPAPAEGFDPIFGYDAIRVPLYVAWAGVGQRQHLAPFIAEWAETPPSVIWIADGAVRAPFRENGYKAVEAVVACVMEGRRPDPALFETLDPLYYPATLQMLSLMALDARSEACP